ALIIQKDWLENLALPAAAPEFSLVFSGKMPNQIFSCKIPEEINLAGHDYAVTHVIGHTSDSIMISHCSDFCSGEWVTQDEAVMHETQEFLQHCQSAKAWEFNQGFMPLQIVLCRKDHLKLIAQVEVRRLPYFVSTQALKQVSLCAH